MFVLCFSTLLSSSHHVDCQNPFNVLWCNCELVGSDIHLDLRQVVTWATFSYHNFYSIYSIHWWSDAYFPRPWWSGLLQSWLVIFIWTCGAAACWWQLRWYCGEGNYFAEYIPLHLVGWTQIHKIIFVESMSVSLPRTVFQFIPLLTLCCQIA